MQQKPIRIKWDQGDRQDETLILNQQVKWHIQRCHDSAMELLKDQGVGGGPNPGNLQPFESSSHSLAYKITQPIKTNHTKFRGRIRPLPGPTLCEVCVSLYLNKFTSYLSLCLSLNSFHDETSRTWVPEGIETRYCGFWLDLSPRTWVQVPSRVLAWFQSHPYWLESQFEVNTFRFRYVSLVSFWFFFFCFLFHSSLIRTKPSLTP